MDDLNELSKKKKEFACSFHYAMLHVALEYPDEISQLLSSAHNKVTAEMGCEHHIDFTKEERNDDIETTVIQSYGFQLSCFVAYALFEKNQQKRNFSIGETNEEFLKSIISKKEEGLIELDQRNKNLTFNLQKMTKELASTSRSLTQIESALRAAESDKLHFRYEAKKLEESNDSLKQKIMVLKKEKKFLMKEVDQYVHKSFALEASLVSLKVELAHLKAAEDERLYFMEQIKTNYGFTWLSTNELKQEKPLKEEADRLAKEGRQFVADAMRLTKDNQGQDSSNSKKMPPNKHFSRCA